MIKENDRMTAKNDCHLKSIVRQTNDLKQRRYSLLQQRPNDQQDLKSKNYYHVMMYDDPQFTYGFSFCNYYYTYFYELLTLLHLTKSYIAPIPFRPTPCYYVCFTPYYLICKSSTICVFPIPSILYHR